MFRKMKIILSFLCVISCCSCTSEYHIKDTCKVYGDFEYLDIDGVLSIVGLSDEGKKKEVLVFPAQIEGRQVNQLGAKISTFMVYKRTVDIMCLNAIKIYVPLTYEKNSYIYTKEKCYTFGNSEYFCTTINHNFVSYAKYNKVNNNDCIPANVVYYIDNEEYFYDDVDDDYISIIPPIPYKEGYVFVGWYKDKECQNLWDFKKNRVPAKKYDEDGNYILSKKGVSEVESRQHQTFLYGKWESKQE